MRFQGLTRVPYVLVRALRRTALAGTAMPAGVTIRPRLFEVLANTVNRNDCATVLTAKSRTGRPLCGPSADPFLRKSGADALEVIKVGTNR
jgi:hypothetical protein